MLKHRTFINLFRTASNTMENKIFFLCIKKNTNPESTRVHLKLSNIIHKYKEQELIEYSFVIVCLYGLIKNYLPKKDWEYDGTYSIRTELIG